MRKTDLEQILSVYVDGELDERQTAAVERLLTTDTNARRIVAEYRALRRHLRGLPQVRLRDDLTQRVFEAAEHRILTESPIPVPREQAHPPRTSSPAPSLWKDLGGRLRQPRAWAYPLIAIAMAVAIMLLLPGDRNREGQPNLAHQNGGENENRGNGLADATTPAPNAPPLPMGDGATAAAAPIGQTFTVRAEVPFLALGRIEDILSGQAIRYRKLPGPRPDEVTYLTETSASQLRGVLEQVAADPAIFGRLDVPDEARRVAASTTTEPEPTAAVQWVLRVR